MNECNTINVNFYSYIVYLSSIPDNITLIEGENLNLKKIVGINFRLIDRESIETVSNNSNIKVNTSGNKKLKLSLLDNILIKDINVDVLPKTQVIPVGDLAGIKLYTNGVLVVGMSEIIGLDNKKYKPYENTGIEEGDTIISINDKEIQNTEDFVKDINSSNGKSIKLEYIHDKKEVTCSITPIKTNIKEYKLGLWVRDSSAGVGTVTFYEPKTKSFGALGHGIEDIDTDTLIDISSGEFVTTKILNIVKGQNGKPGKIQGTIDNQKNIGSISKNTKFGIYGKVDNLDILNIDFSKKMDVALRNEISIGKANILCNIENDKIEKYDIEIEKIFKENNYDNKSMLIKVTDKNLLEKTGGIIQGMSGSPIIQNGKFIGAVTHVLVNNPKEGYAVFGDIMIKNLRSIN